VGPKGGGGGAAAPRVRLHPGWHAWPPPFSGRLLGRPGPCLRLCLTQNW
jgi:hypothetical protein